MVALISSFSWLPLLGMLVPFSLLAVHRGEDVTTSDGQGLNWKWLTGLAISIIGGLIILVGGLINFIVTSKNDELCAIDRRLKTLVENQADLKSTLTEVKTNQSWVITEMTRVRAELSTHEENTKRGTRQ